MPDDFNLSSTDTIIKSPALNAPSSQSALPRRAESCFNRCRTRSSTKGRRSLFQGLSPSSSLAVPSSRVGGSTVLSARNIHVIARGHRPRRCAPASIGIAGQAARMSLGDVKRDRTRLEQREIALLIGRNLAERMKRQMCGFLHRTEGNKANLVGLAHFFERPANT